jgi:hypothetical protein
MNSRQRSYGLQAPKDAAKALAERIADSAGDRLVGINLGGGLTYRDWVDDTSDLDLFCYVDGGLPDIMSWVRDVAGGLTVHQPRDRGSLLEFRQHVGPVDPETGVGKFDANIKAFSIDTMRRYAFGRVSMDEITLEELHSYSKFQVLVDPRGEMTQLLDEFNGRQRANVTILADMALETYGKELSGAIKQRLFRDDMSGSSMQPMFTKLVGDSVSALVCLAYLQTGEYPAPFKWRYHQEFLERLPNGLEIHDLLQQWSHNPHALDPDQALPLIRNLEEQVADYTAPPWEKHSHDKWWWVNFDPQTMSATALSPYAGESIDVTPDVTINGSFGADRSLPPLPS